MTRAESLLRATCVIASPTCAKLRFDLIMSARSIVANQIVQNAHVSIYRFQELLLVLLHFVLYICLFCHEFFLDEALDISSHRLCQLFKSIPCFLQRVIDHLLHVTLNLVESALLVFQKLRVERFLVL